MDNNKWLEIEIQINNDTFQSIDHTDYTGFEDDHYVFHRLQYVKDDDDYTEEAFSILKAETPEELQNPWEVPNIPDGLHYYQKLILPTSQHPISGENESI